MIFEKMSILLFILSPTLKNMKRFPFETTPNNMYVFSMSVCPSVCQGSDGLSVPAYSEDPGTV